MDATTEVALDDDEVAAAAQRGELPADFPQRVRAALDSGACCNCDGQRDMTIVLREHSDEPSPCPSCCDPETGEPVTSPPPDAQARELPTALADCADRAVYALSGGQASVGVWDAANRRFVVVSSARRSAPLASERHADDGGAATPVTHLGSLDDEHPHVAVQEVYPQMACRWCGEHVGRADAVPDADGWAHVTRTSVQQCGAPHPELAVYRPLVAALTRDFELLAG
ncbi:hypothetical protein ER308_04510 [Egibacter rhizosphaerae]|uniref:Uncharacterized protein n=1 Tax=Egibacter rhizosphaerae TaxID=1670831 RepID=A0A411YCG1_9ACTN|nr:hypothetical protein [Egibacter rhizosphaerae]QBI18878.1 hypothetical protein ER308_04510 [Egibacter rhizosphaerae]